MWGDIHKKFDDISTISVAVDVFFSLMQSDKVDMWYPNDMDSLNSSTILDIFWCNCRSRNHIFPDFVLLLVFIVLYGPYLKYSCPYCALLHCMNVKLKNCLASDIHAMG